MSRRKGIKRHDALKPLSRHHTLGLHIGLKLSRSGTEESKITLKEIIADTKKFWSPGGEEHFREEEEIVLPVYAKYADINKPEIVDMLLEHVTIRSGMKQLLNDELTIEEMRNLGKLLQDHIRKEEQIIFPMIEKALPEIELEKLAPYLHEHEE
ncbi:MAG TPA: hemerythrin domain-containing protein [Pseudogracilibacillus sp.]|nr:hemerythrin domain-containing protein [Pseudogracilibacillus sp.]